MRYLIQSAAVLAFLLINVSLVAQNNGGEECNSATYIGTPGGPETCPGGAGFEGEDTDSAAVAVTNPSCDQLGANRDLWYRFTAPPSGGVQLVVECITALRIEAAIFEDCGGQEVDCNASHSDGWMVMGLMPGEDYYLQLWSDAFVSGEFNFCLFEKQGPPPNDSCAGAIALPIQMGNDPCQMAMGTQYNNYGATPSGAVPGPSCSNFGMGRDVWYTVNVPASGTVTIEMLNAIGPQDWAMSIYTGDCNTLSELECDDDDGTGLLPKAELSGLTPGTPLLIRVFEFGGDEFGVFELVATEESTTPPVNDNCASATDITAQLASQGDCVEFCASNINSTPSGELPLPASGCGAFGAGNDIWYTAIAPPTGAMAIELTQHMTSGPQDWALAAYRGMCGSLSFIDCDDDSGTSLYPSLVLPSLTPGERIYIRIWEFQGDQEGSFNICAKGFNPLAVDLLSFHGSPMEEGNAIEWKLADLTGVSHFEVQRRAVEADQWTVQGKVMAEETHLAYYFMDEGVNAPHYYRLVSHETDGSVDYSKTIFISRNEDKFDFTLFPNPSNDYINVFFSGMNSSRKETVNLTIFTVEGKMVSSIKSETYDGQLRFDVRDYKPGLYLLKLEVNGQHWTQKVMIQ